MSGTFKVQHQLPSFHTPYGTVKEEIAQNGNTTFYIIPSNEPTTTKKISEVISDIPLHHINESNKNMIYPKVATLSNGNLKLYFHLKLFGGGESPPELQEAERDYAIQLGIPNANNTSISAKIKENIKKTGYVNSVEVQCINYDFIYLPEYIPTRVIKLGVNLSQRSSLVFKGLGAALGITNNKIFKYTQDRNAMAWTILSGESNGLEDLENAYQRASEINLYISRDLQYIYFELNTSRGEKIYDTITGLKKEGCIII